MNKTELISSVAKTAGVSKKDTEQVLNAFFSTVQETFEAERQGYSFPASAPSRCGSALPARAAIPTPARRSRSPPQRCLRSSRARV